MIIGIGLDLVEIERVRGMLERHPSRARAKLFTPGEVDHCGRVREPVESFAARFAAKEALFKALGTGLSGGARWCDVEVVVMDSGAPMLRLHGPTLRIAEELGVTRAHVSLTHTRHLASAYVVLEGEPAEAVSPFHTGQPRPKRSKAS